MTEPTVEIYQTSIKAVRKYGVTERDSLSLAGKKIHFIGAGGIGMSGLAQIAIENNAIVTGSDQDCSPVTEKLSRFGANLQIGHSPDNIADDTDVVVISAAIKQDNPELKKARQRNCKVYKYAQMLGQIMNRCEGIAIAGTHGKSTTAGWLVYVLKQAGMDPCFIIGARIGQLDSSCGVGQGDYFVAEACEYDRSFLNLKPKIAAVLNIEADHLDYYRDEDEIVDAFRQFALGISPGGVLIANGQDSNVARIIKQLPPDLRRETFGLDQGYDFHADNIQLNNGLYSFEVYYRDRLLGPGRISLPGTHNILNALAVVAVCVNAGMEGERAVNLLEGFTGIDRRLSLKGRFGGITILDDYAHHPTEIKASLQAIRQRYHAERLFCVFQPHQYSRTRFLLDDFAESFKLADVTVLPEIYFIRDSESAKKQVNSKMLVDKICSSGTEAIFIDGFGRIVDYLKKNMSSGDVVVTMGAGDIWKVADEYIQWLGKNC
ncbi:MAG: UDP-N-acetylmuramate--L-alanine ligase [Planctomycetota bacterium]|jgi:UDP-N-acetylmuramate--alanine ligase